MMNMMYENIKLKEHDRGDGVKVQSKVIPFFLPFLEKLALKHPQWTFEEDSMDYRWDNSLTGKSLKTDIVARVFKVLDKREELGSVYYERVYNQGQEYRYCVDNFRVQQMRERGNGMKTIHEKKALKHVDKYFGKKDTSEKLKEASDKAKHCINRTHNDLSRKFDWGWNVVNEVAQEFLISKYWEEFSKHVGSRLKVNIDDLGQLPDRLAQKKAGLEINRAMTNDEHYLVYIEGLSYAVMRPKEGVKLLSSEELPEFIRRGVGMLKLVEDGQIIGGMGLRVDATTFVLLNQT